MYRAWTNRDHCLVCSGTCVEDMLIQRNVEAMESRNVFCLLSCLFCVAVVSSLRHCVGAAKRFEVDWQVEKVAEISRHEVLHVSRGEDKEA